MLVEYLSPMLLGLEEPGCGQLAEVLCQGWAARWPKAAFETASLASTWPTSTWTRSGTIEKTDKFLKKLFDNSQTIPYNTNRVIAR